MRPKLKPLSEQVVVVTGASSGIGLTIARRAAEAGARVMLNSRNEEALREACEEIRGQGGEADYVVGDVGEREDMRRLADETTARFGGFDTWVNDAGIGVYARLEEITDEDHHRLFKTNYWGVVYGSTEALKLLKTRGGALINIGSIASDMPSPLLSAYAATKHAVKGFTDSLRQELIYEKSPVSVTLIKPSGINTPFGQHARNYMDEASRVPPPVYSPQLVADAVLYAAETPVRQLTVGGAGRMMTATANMAPGPADMVFSRLFFWLAKGGEKRPQENINLYEAGEDGEQFGEQKFMRRTSLYTAAQTHPRLSTALGVAASVGATVLAANALRRAGRPARLRLH